mmetsp:Transcript_81153/g.148142  ORF Transcript_81153/g.148142 Transcript_81153/m.148142 type:complete len:386 (-) Transcript_81153:91-1248(-)
MRRILFVVFCLACVGYSRRVQSAVAQGSPAEPESQQRLKAITAFLTSVPPKAAFHSSGRAGLFPKRTFTSGKSRPVSVSVQMSLREDPPGWERAKQPSKENSRKKQTWDGRQQQLLLGRREALRKAAAALAVAGAAPLAAIAKEKVELDYSTFGSIEGQDNTLRFNKAPNYRDTNPQKLSQEEKDAKTAEMKEFNVRYKGDDSLKGDTGDYALEAETQTWTEGVMSFTVPKLWRRADNSSWYDPLDGPTMNKVTLSSFPTNKTDIRQIKNINYLNPVKDLKRDPWFAQCDMMYANNRFVGTQAYYDYIFVLSPASCPNDFEYATACKPTDVYTVSATVAAGKVWTYEAWLKEDGWKRARDDIKASFASFMVDTDALFEEAQKAKS